MRRGQAVRYWSGVVVMLLAAATVSACGGSAGTSAQVPATSAAYQPVMVTDCGGRQSQFTAAPKRVVALTTSVLEMLYWLDLGDRVVGIGTPPKPGTFPPQFDAAVQKLPKLAGPYSPGGYKPVPREQLLAANPDFVIGGFPSNFNASGATSQDELGKSGVNSYLALSTSCSSAVTKPLTTLDVVYQDLKNLGAIFGVPGKAQALIDNMRSKVAGVDTKLANAPAPTVFPFEFDEGTQTPYAPGNRQAINPVITLAHARSIFADLDKSYQKISWEQIAQSNADVILLIVYDKGNSKDTDADFAAAEDFVRGFAPLAGTNAVKQGRFARLVYEEGSNGGVRNAEAVVDLARQLHPGALG